MKIAAPFLFASALAVFAAAPAIADDVRPDKVVELVEQGAIRNLTELNDVALGLHPDATIRDTELEQEYGAYIYTVELRDAQGQEWDVKINAESGEVVKNERDD
ncbi:MAG: PepSY domain-containing protein [Porticoccaceae bacterium]|nr:PepSY domain-containing protein [Porticoccaceae bacterium]